MPNFCWLIKAGGACINVLTLIVTLVRCAVTILLRYGADKMSDIILIFPKTGFDVGATVAPPHSLLTIAAPLKNSGYKIKIIDQRIASNWKDELRQELKSNPICVGISSMTGSQINFALEAARLVRQEGKVEKLP